MLILGGTVFLGRAVVDAALERGCDVTLLHRGNHPSHRSADAAAPHDFSTRFGSSTLSPRREVELWRR